MTPGNDASDWVPLSLDGQACLVEYRWINAANTAAPLLVFLHEGLGSVAMWRDFPQRLCDAAGCRGLLWSRPGYGRSTSRPPQQKWGTDFMHVQALQLMPQLFQQLGIDAAADPPWLFGHSDGGSIALIHAAHHPLLVTGLIVLAPHIVVEDISVASIAQARAQYVDGDLRTRLARYHDDVDSAFWGWNDIWLDPDFRQWDITPLLPAIRCPLLAVQGEDDVYGTMAQIDGIADAVPHTQRLELDACGHSPHRDQPQAVIDAAIAFMGGAAGQ